MDQTDYDLLARIERGSHVFRPRSGSAEDRAAFQAVIEHLIYLRGTGLIRLPEGRLMRSEDGSYLMAGPCDLTTAGIAALSKDRSLGPRPPQSGPGRLWKGE
jgi:hypothetical protein